MSGWALEYDEFDAGSERLREALCTVGNGYIASRGAAAGAEADDVHYPGTYIAGCFNRLTTSIAGESIENESMVNIPNWTLLRIRPNGGAWFDPAGMSVLDYRQSLDLKNAVLSRSFHFRDPDGRRTRLFERRLISIDQCHTAALEITVEAENWDGAIEVLSALDGTVENRGVERYRDLNGRHLLPIATASDDSGVLVLEVQTSQSHIRIAEAARTRFWCDGNKLEPIPATDRRPAYVAHRFQLELSKKQPLYIEKTAVIHCSRDDAISAPALDARATLERAGRFGQLEQQHTKHWTQLWRRFDLDIEHDDPAIEERTERLLRLHILQLLQTTSPRVMDLDVGVPARGLHGEAYRGHIFWDELFVFPIFNLRMPEITRALLQYRYRRLEAARVAAREAGFRGAMFPWQSGSNGREESQRIHLNPKSGNWIPDNTWLQRHINSAIAYNVWQYYQVTRDTEFLAYYGAEMIFEIARFWASIATFDTDSRRYRIRGVLGPDEFHDGYPHADSPGLDDNAYTNLMAVWVLRCALELRQVLPTQRYTELCETLALSKDEFAQWEAISRRMTVPFHGDGIISQFAGYDQLQEFDWAGYREKYGDIHRLDRILESENDTPNRYKLSKQADVLMLFYLFSAEELVELLSRIGYEFDPESIPVNIDYYLSRTSHGSTLSHVVHSWVLARSDRPGGWPLFQQALESDIADIQGGTTEEGIHVGAMAGTVDLIQRCFTGIETRGDVLWFNPRLPKDLNSLALKLYYRQHELVVRVTQKTLRISAEPTLATPIRIGVQDDLHELGPGETREFEI